MKKLSVLSVMAVLLFTACVESGEQQFTEMPAGPLQRYYFIGGRGMSEDTTMIVELWRVDSLKEGGLLSYWDVDERHLGDMPMPILVDEQVFTDVYNQIKEKKLYAMADWYKTSWKADAYGYAPWTFIAEFPEAKILTVSDGSTPKGYEGGTEYCVNHYLRKIFEKVGYEWLAKQPASLEEYTRFSNLRQRFIQAEPEDNGNTAANGVLTFELHSLVEDSLLDTFSLKPDGENRYRDLKTGRRIELRRVEGEVMAICYERDEQPLWAMCGHQSCYEEGCLEHKLEYVTNGRYKDNNGEQVLIEGHEIQGFPDRGKQRCVIYNYHDYPAERLHIGSYPDEKDWAFRRSKTGLNLYETRYETDDSTDWNTVPTQPVQCLHDTGNHNYQWLHHDVLDSYILGYFDATQRKAMLYIVENPEEDTTPFDTWNAWLLRTFDSVVPFEAEEDFK